MGFSAETLQDSAALKFLLQSLHACISEHQICRKDFYGQPRDPDHKPQLPTRILSVGNPSSEHLKLIEQRPDEESPLVGQYVALSHCWGPPEKHSITTTTENISQHRVDIPFNALSRTFQDAVTITRKLGLEYLWIDSLCIVQNDKKDWEEEAPRMGTVYEEAYLTICATGAVDGSEGCFAVANDVNQEAAAVPKRSADCPADDFRWTYSNKSLHNDILGPLQNRAWVTQEWVLSLRQIHFCRGRLAWHCDEVQKYNGGSNLNLILRSNEVLNEACPESSPWLEETEPRYEKVKLAWRWIAQEYTERDLTITSDKFAAMLGLIQKIQRDDEHACPYGIMTDNLPYSLAWSRWETGQYLQRPQELRTLKIPSWSWASTMGRIDYTRGFPVDRAWSLCKCSYDPSLQAMVITSKEPTWPTTYLLSSARLDRSSSLLLDEGSLEEMENNQECEYFLIPIIYAHPEASVHCLLAKPVRDKADFYERVGMAWYLEFNNDVEDDEMNYEKGHLANGYDTIYLI